MSATWYTTVHVGDSGFLEINSEQIRGLWQSWEPGSESGEGFQFADPAWGGIYDDRGGAFAPNNLSNFAVDTVNLLPMSGSSLMAMRGHMAH